MPGDRGSGSVSGVSVRPLVMIATGPVPGLPRNWCARVAVLM
jgi:hypothetical protein